MKLGPRTIAIAALGACALALSGCAVPAPPSSSFCVPRFTIEPSTVTAGDSIRLSSDSRCDADRPEGGWVVIAAPVGAPERGVRVIVDDEFDGTFRVELDLPSNFPAGDAFAGVENWDYSECADTGSCASASGSFTVSP